MLGGLNIDFPGEIFEELILTNFSIEKLRVLSAQAFFTRIFYKKLGLRQRRRRKGICLDDVRTRFEKAFVDVANGIRLREGKDVAVVQQILFVVLKPLTSRIGFLKAVATNRCSHRPIEDKDAFFQFGGEFLREV